MVEAKPKPRGRNVTRRSTSAKAIPKKEAMRKVVDLVAAGNKIGESMAAVGRTYDTYKQWYREDLEFQSQIKYLRQLAERAAQRKALGDDVEPVPDFPDFCRDFLGQPLYEHQLRMYDVICGREPRSLHQSMVFRPGRPARVLMNVPPDHAKTTTFTVNFVTWLIHKNPDVRVVIVSKTQNMAKRMLGAIKFRLLDASFREMHLRFAPEGGWKDPDQSWNLNEIYVKGRGTGEKDPTVQALGIGGHLQGARSDFILLDDVVDRANANAWEDQADWLAQIVTSRLPDDDETVASHPDAPGKLLVFGTRNAPVELYQKLRDEFVDYDGNPIWTYFAQPAVLEYGDSPEDWVTLWPTITDRHGVVKRKWDGKALAKRRGDVRDESLWALTFQQQDVAENAIFPSGAVHCAVNGARLVGPMPTAGTGASRGDLGMTGLYVVAGLDPATVGHTAIVVMGVDRESKRRYLLDGVNHAAMTPHELRSAMKDLTIKYRVREWVIETNAYQKAIVQDEELKDWLANTGCRVRGHYTTSKNKFDADFGVASMAALFLSCGDADSAGRWHKRDGGGLIELPNIRISQVMGSLVSQLCTWVPDTKNQVTDLVMALWFAEVGAREWLGVEGRASHFLADPYLSRHQQASKQVINLNDWAQKYYAAV